MKPATIFRCHMSTPAMSSESDEPDRPANESARRSTRVRRPPEYLKDFVTQSAMNRNRYVNVIAL